MISLIAAIGQNRELGRNGELIFHLPEDMRFFRETTTGHPVLMGYKTYQSIGRPLPGRENYVATHHPERLPDIVHPVADLDKFLQVCYNDSKELFVIGGSAIYSVALTYATTLYLTEIEAAAPDADVFFPDFDHSKYHRTVIKKGKDDDLAYSFVKYTLI